MFFKVGFLGLALFLSVYSGAMAQEFCKSTGQAPNVQVDWQQTPVYVNHRLSRQQLAQQGKLLITVYSNTENHTIGGLTRSQLKIGSGAQMKIEQLDGNSCISFNSIHVTMETAPIIYIAADIPEGSCLYRETYNHELKHYNVEDVLVRDYRVLIQKQLFQLAQSRGIIGPFGSGYLPQVQQDMIKQMETVLSNIKARMDQERIQLQGMIDTRQEYERIAAACPQQRQ